MKDLITDNNLIVGINKCLDNAENLIRDADILKKHQSIERAYTLFQLSLEETGKAAMVFFFATLSEADKISKLNTFKKEFLNHKVKTAKAINFDHIILSSIKEKGERNKFLKAMLLEHENIDTFNNLKNYSLYTSIIGSKFLSPKELITTQHLEGIEERATTRFKLVRDFLEFSLKHFNSTKKAVLEADNDQIEKCATEYLKDLVSEK